MKQDCKTLRAKTVIHKYVASDVPVRAGLFWLLLQKKLHRTILNGSKFLQCVRTKQNTSAEDAPAKSVQTTTEAGFLFHEMSCVT